MMTFSGKMWLMIKLKLKSKKKKKTGRHPFFKKYIFGKNNGECQTELSGLLRIKTLANLNLIRLVYSFTNC